MASVVQPHVEPWEFDAIQENKGWDVDIELIAGEVVVVLPLGDDASKAQGELHLALRLWQEQVDDSGLVLQDVLTTFPDGSRLAPDISWWRAERRPPRSRGAVRVVPDLAVEVHSPSTRANDEGIKRELYMRLGVRELWLVDPNARAVTRVSPDAAPDETLGEGETLTSELLPGFALEVAAIFPFDAEAR
jgi:Uma2 family endonuclease